MKKQPLSLLVCIMLLFCAFTLGFFLGRNRNHEVIYLSTVSTQARHNVTVPPDTGTEPEREQISFPIDINAATLNELTSLPGIGETLARRILDYRDANGSFSRPEELMHVEGIGAGKLEAILDYIKTGG